MGAKSPDWETHYPTLSSSRYQNTLYPGRSKTWIRYLEQAGGNAKKAFRLQEATYAEGRIKATKKKIDYLLASEATAATDEERAALSSKITEMRGKVRSLQAKVNALRRAGQADYDGIAATKPAQAGSQQRYLDLAGGDPVKAKRLRKADLLEGRLTSAKKKLTAARSRLRKEQLTRNNSEVIQRLMDEVSEKQRRARSMQSTIAGLRRAAAPEYNGKAVAERLQEASHRHYLDLAQGVEEEAKRLRMAALSEGRSKAKGERWNKLTV